MISVNAELRASYVSLLSGNVLINSQAVPIYYGQVPINNPPLNPSNYILINSIFSSGFNDDSFNYTTTTVQLMIVTKALQNNSGADADDIAYQILCIIIPGPEPEVVQITSGQVINTVLSNDLTQTGLNDGQQKVLNRLLFFRHQIRHFPCNTGMGLIFYGTQDTDDDPTDFTNSLNQNCSLSITVDYGFFPLATPKFYWLAVPEDCPLKTDWTDMNDTGNAAKIGATTDLYEVRSMLIDTLPYTLYITRYVTGWNGYSSIVRYS